ncbi:MAG: 4-(cytidine 5'-diphospho)-2-C-methyl-D-erythritol kinase [Candidatus Melainabacteria bacterium]|nr:4-(cytidine 5'-diphospho)-2-C-methyl-D-erythritol kinase [Candidatus Melainabacteria bacterium]
MLPNNLNMHKLVARSPAKLNLTLEVVGQRPNGYHEISTIMQAINLEDDLSFEFSSADRTEVTIACTAGNTIGKFPCDDSNLIAKAVKQFLAVQRVQQGLAVQVVTNKRIPIGAGLGGGSSNAAATLLALNCHFGYPFSHDELLVLGGKLGADVPFCLRGGTCVGRGLGDELEPIKTVPHFYFILVKPRNLSVSTQWAYEAFDDFSDSPDQGSWSYPDLVGAINGISNNELQVATSCFGNDLEPVVFAHYPELTFLKEQLLALGSWCCHLTGSGPTLYAAVANIEMAHSIKGQFFQKLSSTNLNATPIDFWITESINYGTRLIAEL